MLNKLKTPPPGAHLKELLEDFGISNYRLAKASGISATAIGQIIAGNRRITAETAIRLAVALNMSPQFWLNAQTHFDLMQARAAVKTSVSRIEPLFPAANAKTVRAARRGERTRAGKTRGEIAAALWN